MKPKAGSGRMNRGPQPAYGYRNPDCMLPTSAKFHKPLLRLIGHRPEHKVRVKQDMKHLLVHQISRRCDVWCGINSRLKFLAATKQLYKWYFPSVRPSVRLSVCPSVRLSVCLSHLFDYVPIIASSWNFQELLPMTKVRSMQKVKVRGQRSRSQRSQPNLTVSGL